MPKRIEIKPGQKIGMLTIQRIFKGVRSGLNCDCQCNCGKRFSLQASKIKAGIRSCGCNYKKYTNLKKGDIFGKLTVLEPGKISICKCECGSILPVLAGNLLWKNTKSCGCTRKVMWSKKRKIKPGYRVGRWTVLKELGLNSNNHSISLCICDCGKEKVVTQNALKTGNSLSCGCLKKERTSARCRIRPRDMSEREYNKLKSKSERLNLTNSYIKKVINCHRIPIHNIPQPLIDCKRQELKIKRFLKENNYDSNSTSNGQRIG
jgi:hypothetical protein